MEERGGAWESNGEKGGATVIEQQFKKIGKRNSSLEGITIRLAEAEN